MDSRGIVIVGKFSCETLMLVLGKALSTGQIEEESSHWVKYTECCSIFTGIIEALGNKYSLVCVKPHLEPNFSSNPPFMIK